jgi:hypothetical protein
MTGPGVHEFGPTLERYMLGNIGVKEPHFSCDRDCRADG